MSFSGNKWENPSDLSCFSMCRACYRCEDKGTKAACNRCSGRHDPELKWDAYDREDRCRCKEGLLQYRTQKGELIRAELNDPFGGRVVHQPGADEDEKEWNEYLARERERRDDPTWDPVTIDGESATDKFGLE